MHITRLELTDFRNWRRLGLELEPGVTVFLGRNGQGKTNLVEAVAYFSSLGSHRVAQDAALIRAGREQAVVRLSARYQQRELSLDLQLNRQGANRAQLNGKAVRQRELPGYVSTVLFAPEDLALVRAEPSGRRRFMDQLLIQRTPRLAGVLADYERVVRQRTTLLKSARANSAASLGTLQLWDDKLVELGSILMQERWMLLAALRPHLIEAYGRIADGGHDPDLGMSLSILGTGSAEDALAEEGMLEELAGRAGTDAANAEGADGTAGGGGYGGGAGGRSSLTAGDRLALLRSIPDSVPEPAALQETFRARLDQLRPRELERGLSMVGPHRDDAVFWLNGLPARGYASHGESWSFALSLKLASAALLREHSRAGDPVLILDDVFAELDAGRRARLGSAIDDYEQVLITAAVAEDLPPMPQARLVRIHAGALVEGGGGGDG